jgi:NAD(P)-dependent dehydrogenase (short-subunit alcohol dehydrogenase family)
MDITGKNIIITGAASGIGMEAAFSLTRKDPCETGISRKTLGDQQGIYRTRIFPG